MGGWVGRRRAPLRRQGGPQKGGAAIWEGGTVKTILREFPSKLQGMVSCTHAKKLMVSPSPVSVGEQASLELLQRAHHRLHLFPLAAAAEQKKSCNAIKKNIPSRQRYRTIVFACSTSTLLVFRLLVVCYARLFRGRSLDGTSATFFYFADACNTCNDKTVDGERET